ncbi:MAG: beta-glucosidase [Sphingobacteriales bacterium SCN 48-20]|uniref:glucoamylase family protein n=1 Tax=Terrimonas ferruginea TaxID=249 RepID=UPI00086B44A4|nr:glucoamylase family protein [Terrimonas ferruginea]ODT92322.1 MAG: beta-glucosidase [Sphingobacteriales bacterium SCN 48-20]OJW40561.1 MAG: beta-glucosidase [Sphingobacteriales bacterium 48-107]
MNLFSRTFQWFVCLAVLLLMNTNCKKSDGGSEPQSLTLSFTVNGSYNGTLSYNGLNNNPTIRFTFSSPIDQATIPAGITLKQGGTSVNYTQQLENNNTILQIKPAAPLSGFSSYNLTVTEQLRSRNGGRLLNPVTINLSTGIDSSRKFPQISDEELLTKVQQQTFKYFWDFAHPTSFLARERSNGNNNVVTSGGSGFGVMAIVTGVERGFVTRTAAVTRLRTMVGFLKNTAVKVKGAFSHWIDGTTGAIVPFSANDNGADLVETSLLMQGLLTARQYFNGAGAEETALRADINAIWNGIDWDWFRRGGQNTLYWHYSDNLGWAMNLPIRGWNECLITYVLAASAPTNPIPKIVYDNGWAANGAIRNGNNYYGYTLPLGPDRGGPLFLSHYSFLGINPNGLVDAYANYNTQVRNHALINYEYCKQNPRNYYGYSDSVWGLTASDIPNGYTASSPTNDVGVIAPTAALSSFPYTPQQSLAALRFFYYVLGDRLWKEYGFIDAFSLKDQWFAGSHLAIDQGPIIIMIENYRTGLLWNLFTSCPEIKTGMRNLGFTAPYL